jgi:hypothetical protein
MNKARAVAVLCAALAGGCGSNDPTAEIRALLAEAEQAAEARDTSFFRNLIGVGYRDAQGNDRDQVIGLLRGYFIANQKVEIVSRVDEVLLEGADAAHAVVHAGLLGQRAGAAMLGGIDGNLYRFELELVHDGGQWQIIGATVSRAVGE